jgi:hypothetical protein
MTPQEKAKELFDKFNFDLRPFSEFGEWDTELAKQCALIAIDEIIVSFTAMSYGLLYLGQINYWEEVKQEIEKL